MDSQVLLKQIDLLPEKAKEEALLFLEFLMNKYQIPSTIRQPETLKKRIFGISKGDYQIQSDFEDELDEFKPYMPE